MHLILQTEIPGYQKHYLQSNKKTLIHRSPRYDSLAELSYRGLKGFKKSCGPGLIYFSINFLVSLIGLARPLRYSGEKTPVWIKYLSI